MTSLNSGLPSRDTCTYGPDSMVVRVVVAERAPCGRLADVHTPITGVG